MLSGTRLATPLQIVRESGAPWTVSAGERCTVLTPSVAQEFTYCGRDADGTPVYEDATDGGRYRQGLGEHVLPAPLSDSWYGSDEIVYRLIGWDDPCQLAPGDPIRDRRSIMLPYAHNLRLAAAWALRIAAQVEERATKDDDEGVLTLLWSRTDEDGMGFQATWHGLTLSVECSTGERWAWCVCEPGPYGVLDAGVVVGRTAAMFRAEMVAREAWQ